MKHNKSFLLFFICINQNVFSDSWHCEVSLLGEILKNNTQIQYTRCNLPYFFEYKKIPLAGNEYLHPHKGIFKETFIITIPNGHVLGKDGWILIGDTLIDELIWQNVFLSKSELQQAKMNPIRIKHGRVAVITQTGYEYYYHWMLEVLGRLALLEMQGIEYDFLYVPNSARYMRETLELWGVEPSKIIESSDDVITQADILIAPSLVSHVMVDGLPRLVHYIPDYIVRYVKNKLLNAITCKDGNRFNKRIFISRQDAGSRKILNEDEVFAVLQKHGFQRYYLTKMSIIDQITLFNNAEIIVSALGSGLTNLIFCDPTVKIVELYQARRDSTLWNLAQMVGLPNYKCIKTVEFIDENEGQYDTEIPLQTIEEIIMNL